MKLSSILKESTASSHQQLEKVLISKLKAVETISGYIAILKAFYAFTRPLEMAIKASLNHSLLPDYPERRKSEALLADIFMFEPDVRLKQCADLPKIENKFHALGALYVLEGSTLGGQIISNLISQKLGSAVSNGLSYFNGYGPDTVAMWQKFRLVIDDDGFSESDKLDVVAGAEQTFIKFKNCLA